MFTSLFKVEVAKEVLPAKTPLRPDDRLTSSLLGDVSAHQALA